MGMQTVIYSYSETLLSAKKEQTSGMCNSIDESHRILSEEARYKRDHIV